MDEERDFRHIVGYLKLKIAEDNLEKIDSLEGCHEGDLYIKEDYKRATNRCAAFEEVLTEIEEHHI